VGVELQNGDIGLLRIWNKDFDTMRIARVVKLVDTPE
jgi:hypothetical protein